MSANDNALAGVLERIIYFNEENHYCIGEFRDENSAQTITITGNLPGVQCGETLQLKGDWTNHPQHGRQFRIQSYTAKLPSSVYGIRKYLGSGLVPGIGKGYANKIVDAFGADTLRVISEESGRLREVDGIGQQRAKSIKKAWDEQSALRNVMMFLQTYGVGTSQCLRLVKHYGNEAQQILQTEPYRVAREIQYIGFKTADKIALNLGFANDSPGRLDAGIIFALQELESEGHTCCEFDTLNEKAAELLDADVDKITERINSLIKDSSLVYYENLKLLQLPASNKAETSIAETLSSINKTESALPAIAIGKAIAWAQDRAGFTFAEAQSEAINASLSNKLSVITGGPGTGKTTILRAVVDILKAKKVQILMAAPTGRAAQRMSDAAGVQAHTIHRLLKYDPAENRFTFDNDNPLKTDYLIIDESSMLDNKLAASLIRAVPFSVHILFVGDIYQLPSVGAGNFLEDLIRSKICKVIKLDKIFRQQNQSSIVSTAHEILNGNPRLPEATASLREIDHSLDLHFIKADEPEKCLRIVEDLCDMFSSENPQVLAPMHRGTAGIGSLNFNLQQKLNSETRSLNVGQNKYKAGDKVIQTRNNYDKNIFNGDIGVIREINKESATLTVDFDIGPVELERLDLGNLQPAYAISIHKSQGSEFPLVIIPLMKQHYMMLQRNLIYTAITRGRKKVFIVGEPAAYAMAVKNVNSKRRETDLRRKIEETM